MAKLSENEVAELAVTYASLILHDDNVPITADKLNAIVSAAGVKVAPYWTNLFARVLATKNLDDLLTVGGGSAAPAAAAAPVEAKSAAPAADKGAKEEKKKKEEPKEQSDEDMGFGLFD